MKSSDRLLKESFQLAQSEIDRLKAEVERLVAANRYALATFRALERYTFEDSDHGLLIAEAVSKLEALASVESGENEDER